MGGTTDAVRADGDGQHAAAGEVFPAGHRGAQYAAAAGFFHRGAAVVPRDSRLVVAGSENADAADGNRRRLLPDVHRGDVQHAVRIPDHPFSDRRAVLRRLRVFREPVLENQPAYDCRGRSARYARRGVLRRVGQSPAGARRMPAAGRLARERPSAAGQPQFGPGRRRSRRRSGYLGGRYSFFLISKKIADRLSAFCMFGFRKKLILKAIFSARYLSIYFMIKSLVLILI